jgi:hypothetical protein
MTIANLFCRSLIHVEESHGGRIPEVADNLTPSYPIVGDEVIVCKRGGEKTLNCICTYEKFYSSIGAYTRKFASRSILGTDFPQSISNIIP